MTDDTLALDRVSPDSAARPGPVRPAESAPVFVDASGRRQRRVRRVGRLLAIPAAGYVVLLVSSALGGPTVNSPFLPLPAAQPTRAAPSPATAPAPDSGTASDRPTNGTARPPAAASAPALHWTAAVTSAPAPATTAPATTPAPAPTTNTPSPAPSRTHPDPTHKPHP